MLPVENTENSGRWRAEDPGPSPLPLYNEAEAARFLAGWDDPAVALGRARWAHDHGYIRREHPGEGPNDATRYGLDDVGVLAALTPLWEMGARDRGISTTASNALYGWRDGQTIPDDWPGRQSPIAAALYGSRRGELWLLHIRLLRFPSGQRLTGAYVYNSDNPPRGLHPPPGTAPLADLHVCLLEVLLPLTRALPDGRH